MEPFGGAGLISTLTRSGGGKRRVDTVAGTPAAQHKTVLPTGRRRLGVAVGGAVALAVAVVVAVVLAGGPGDEAADRPTQPGSATPVSLQDAGGGTAATAAPDAMLVAAVSPTPADPGV